MSDTTIDSLTIGVSFDTKQLSNSAKEIQNTIGDMSKNITSKLRGALDVLTTGFGLNVAKNMIEGFANAGANLSLLSKSIGENVSSVGAWQQAVIRVGGTAEGFANTITSLHDRVANSRYGSGDPMLTGVLSILGINAFSDGKIKKSTDLLKETLGALHKIQNPDARRLRGQQLGLDDATIRLANLSPEELNKQLDQMQKLGVLTEEQAKKDLELKRTIDDLKQSFGMAAQELATQFFPSLKVVGDWMTKHPSIIKSVTAAIAGLTVAFIALKAASLALASPLALVAATLAGIYALFQNRELIKNWAKKEDLQWLVELMNKLDSTLKDVNKFFQNPSDNFKYYLKANGIESPQDTTQSRITNKGNINAYEKLMSGKHPMSSLTGDAALNDPYMKEMQKLLESSGGRRKVGYKNGVPYAFGDYQISMGTARALGFKGSPEELMNNKDLNEKLRNAALKDIMKDKRVGNDMLKAYAVYNSGWEGLEYLKKNGHTRNYYGENIMSAGQNHPAKFSPTTQNNSQNTHVSINTMQLSGLQNPNEFIQGMADKTATGWAYSNPYISR